MSLTNPRSAQRLPEGRTDAESLRLADAFNRLARFEEFQQYQNELAREQAFLVEQMCEGRLESHEAYLEARGLWQGLRLARDLVDVVVEEAVAIEAEEPER